MLLAPGTTYEIDGVSHQIPPSERFKGWLPRLTPRKQEFLTQLKRLLAHFHERCEQHGITYYLSCGTLLGAVKMEAILPWDTDADVSIPASEVGKLPAAFADSPFRLVPFRFGYKLAMPNFLSYPFVDIMVVDQVATAPRAGDMEEEAEEQADVEEGVEATGNVEEELAVLEDNLESAASAVTRALSSPPLSPEQPPEQPPEQLPIPHATEPVYTFSYPLRQGRPTFGLRRCFPRKRHPHSMIYPLRQYKIEGMWLWGPRDATAFCVQNYGPECLTSSFVKPFRKHWLTGLLRV